MSLLQPLLSQDPASPRLTVYNEHSGTRMEFSATTLDNWANKIANMMTQEFNADQDTLIRLDLPVTWQATVIPVGIYSAGCAPAYTGSQADIVFTTPEGADNWPDAEELIVVSDDPLGRGVEESGGDLPVGAVDFSPTARFYGDQYFGPAPDLAVWRREDIAAERYLVPAWTTQEEFDRCVMAPLAAGGSVIVVTGVASTDRLEQIAQMEKSTASLF